MKRKIRGHSLLIQFKISNLSISFLLFCLLLLGYPASLIGQQKEKLIFLESTELIISGKTNINEFTCRLINENIDEQITTMADITDGVELFKGVNLHFKVSDLKCDIPLMTSELRTLLKAEDFPIITMGINDVLASGSYSAHGNDLINAKITLNIAGHNEDELIQNAEAVQTNHSIILSGSHHVLLTNFKIQPPTKLFGAIQTEDIIEIYFSIVLK